MGSFKRASFGKGRSMLERIPGWRLLSWRRCATVAAFLLTVALGFHVVFGQNGLTAYQRKRDTSRELSRQARSLQRENEFLRGHVARLGSDPGAIEHQAREELHYTRPGEVIYTLPAAPAPVAPASPAVRVAQ